MRPAQKILITGSRGYIGTHLRCFLRNKNIEFVEADISAKDAVDLRYMEELRQVFGKNEISHVVHLAASIIVSEGESDPIGYLQNNVTSTLNLLDIMREFGCKNIVFASSAAVYNPCSDQSDIGLTEESPATDPKSTYGLSKLICEKMIERSGVNYICLRFFNVAGTNRELNIMDPNPHLLPELARRIASGKNIKIYGDDYPTRDGTCIRDYVHVDDICQGIFLSLGALCADQDKRVAKIYNLGSNSGYSVKEVIDDMLRIYEEISNDGQPQTVTTCERRAGDPATLIASSDLVRRELGWSPEHDMGSIISSLAFFFR